MSLPTTATLPAQPTATERGDVDRAGMDPSGAEPADDVAAAARAPRLHPELSELVVAPEDPGPGSWAGAPSALLVDGTFYLAYRLRRPVGRGRGYANVVARSTDGIDFEVLAVIDKDAFGAESLERPALAVTPGGRWRAYVSCATPGTAHWRVDVLEAATPAGLAQARPRTVLPGSDTVAVKDPVIARAGKGWELWASCHPLADPDAHDRMTTQHATSPDGLAWTWTGTALAGRPGSWDERGVRIAAVLPGPTPLAFYDGRATQEENWEERTGLAVGVPGTSSFRAVGDEPVGASPEGARGLRYVSVVDLPGGGRRLYYELTRADGAHELRTQLVAS